MIDMIEALMDFTGETAAISKDSHRTQGRPALSQVGQGKSILPYGPIPVIKNNIEKWSIKIRCYKLTKIY